MNDVPAGPVAYFGSDSVLLAKGAHAGDNRVGDWFIYDDGQLHKRERYDADTLTEVEHYDSDGLVTRQLQPTDDSDVWLVEEFDDAGSLKGHGPWRVDGDSSIRVGTWTLYGDGAIYAVGTLNDSELVGRWTYFRNGQPIHELDHDFGPPYLINTWFM